MEQQSVEITKPDSIVGDVSEIPSVVTAVKPKQKRTVSEKQREALTRARNAKKARVDSMAQQLAKLEEENNKLKVQQPPRKTKQTKQAKPAAVIVQEYSYTYESEDEVEYEKPEIIPQKVTKTKAKPKSAKAIAKPAKRTVKYVEEDEEKTNRSSGKRIPLPPSGFFSGIF